MINIFAVKPWRMEFMVSNARGANEGGNAGGMRLTQG